MISGCNAKIVVPITASDLLKNLLHKKYSGIIVITEIEILNEGNLFKGLKRGTVTTNDGLIITANEFEYDKILNLLNARGNVKIEDKINDYYLIHCWLF